jgi:acetyl esterase/lipase
MIDLLRFVAGTVLLTVASLTIVGVPNRAAWGGTLAATEYGYWLALLALFPLIPSRTQSMAGRLGALLSVVAIPFLVFPVYRAHSMGLDLQRTFEARFGNERRDRPRESEDPRANPVVIRELINPLEVPAVRYEQRVFADRQDQKLTLDLYRPQYVHQDAPGVIVVHGGGWQSGDNGESRSLNAYLASRDYVVASINYRLAPRSHFPAQRDDVFAAIAYLKTHGKEFGVDASRLALLGRAEGGQLALLAAYASGEPSIRGVVAISAPTDLRQEYDNPPPASWVNTRALLEAFVGGSPTQAEKAYADASPVTFVSPSSPPTLLIHGLRDPVISADQSSRLEERLQNAGVKHVFVKLPWATHACDTNFAGPCGQITTYAVERFLDAVMIPAPSLPPVQKHKLARR